MSKSVAWGLVPLFALGCLSQDPAHCANREGNATCAMLGEAAHCSICTAENYGCVAEEPADRCYRPGPGGGEATGSDTGSSTAASSGETAEAQCVEEACPESAPYCVGGVCGGCGDAAFCGARDADVPACHPGSGICVRCVVDDECEAGVCGDAYACVECARHDDCPFGACNLGNGNCFAATVELWVQTGSGCTAPGIGTSDEPYCSLATAVADAGGGVSVIRVLGTDVLEEEVVIGGNVQQTIAVIAEGTPVLAGIATAITVTRGSELFLSGFRIRDATTNAVWCNDGSQVWLSDVALENNATAVTGESCGRVVLERAVVSGSSGDAIVVDAGALEIVSSAFVDNGTGGADTAAVRVGNAELAIRYSTFADNRGTQRGSVACTSTAGEIRNSVLVSSDAPSVDCDGVMVRTSVVDGEVPGEGLAVVEGFDPTWFQNVDMRDVSVPDPSASPFRDVAVWGEGDPLRELSGTRRLAYPGLAEFAGADQP